MSQGIIPPAAISTPSLSGDQTWTGQQNFSGGLGSTRMAGPDPWFDVTHPKYAGGADSTGVADSRAAIQAAINAAAVSPNGGTVFFPIGNYVVNATLTLPANVFLVGQAHRVGSTAGVGFALAPGIDGLIPTGDRCGVQGVSFNGGARQIYIANGRDFFKIKDCTFINPTTCGIYNAGSSQWWELDEVGFGGGQYGIYMPANGSTTWVGAACRNVGFSGQSKKAMYFKFDIVSGGVLWDHLRITFLLPATSTDGGGITVDSTGSRHDGWIFQGLGGEAMCGQQAGMTAYTTCSGTSGGTTVTLAAKTGVMCDGSAAWVNGQQVTIGGVRVAGNDFTANITNVSGLVLTLDATLPTTFTTAPITPYTVSELELNGSASFINAEFGSSAGTRYSLDVGHDAAGGPVAVFGTGKSQVGSRPIYDPYCKVYTQSTAYPIRRASGNVSPSDRNWLSHSYLEALSPWLAVNEAIWPRRSQLATPGGGDFRIAMLGNSGGGGGPFGTFRLTKSDVADGTDVLTCDANGNVATLAAGTVAPGSNITANRPSTTGLAVGAMFFDTTLNKPIWWNGANWKDATGATV